jgi:GT2 family glycosyltransferase
VVIINYRTPALTIDCLKTLAPEVASVPGARCVLVDNASGDDSVPRIRNAIEENGWSSWLTFVASDENRGFAGGNNLGIAQGEPADFVLLLNSDTLVHPGCIARCLEVMEQNPRAGAMSCRVLNADGSMQNVTRRFPTPLRAICCNAGLPWKAPGLFAWADTEDPGWDRTTTAREVDWLGGAFMFIRSAALGGRVRLDEDFFFYGEDIAFCHRLHRLGWTCHYDPVASIVHLGGASSDPSRLPSAERSVHQWRARYLVQRKCHGAWAAHTLRSADAVLTGLRFARAAVRGAAHAPRKAELKNQLERIFAAESWA